MTHILFRRLHQRLVSLFCVMEKRNRLMQCLRRIIGKHPEKSAEGPAALRKIPVIPGLVQADRIRHKKIHAPTVSLLIRKEFFSIQHRNHRQRLPVRISIGLPDLPPQKLRHTADIFHQLLWRSKHLPVHPLQNKLCSILSGQKIRIVNMAAAIGPAFYNPLSHSKPLSQPHLFSWLHILFLPHVIFIILVVKICFPSICYHNPRRRKFLCTMRQFFCTIP